MPKTMTIMEALVSANPIIIGIMIVRQTLWHYKQYSTLDFVKTGKSIERRRDLSDK